MTGRVFAAPPPSVMPDTAESEAIRHHATSMDGVAMAIVRLAAAVEAATVQRQPADLFYAEANRRLNAVWRWLMGKWPWIVGVAAMSLAQVLGAAPEEAPKLVAALVDAARAAGGL